MYKWALRTSWFRPVCLSHGWTVRKRLKRSKCLWRFCLWRGDIWAPPSKYNWTISDQCITAHTDWDCPCCATRHMYLHLINGWFLIWPTLVYPPPNCLRSLELGKLTGKAIYFSNFMVVLAVVLQLSDQTWPYVLAMQPNTKFSVQCKLATSVSHNLDAVRRRAN